MASSHLTTETEEPQKKKVQDHLKKSFKSCHIDPNQWITDAAEHDGWHQTVVKAANNFEITCCEALDEKRQRIEPKAASTSSNPNRYPYQTFTCRQCNIMYLSWISPVSHRWASRKGGHPS